LNPSSVSGPNTRSSPSPRDGQVGRGPLAVVRPTPSAVDEFGSETADAAPAPSFDSDAERDHKDLPAALPAPPSVPNAFYIDRASWPSINVKWVSALVVVGVIAGLVWTLGVPAWRAGSTAQLTIETVPVGAQVLVGNAVRGVTPLVLQLPPGPSKVIVRVGGSERVLSVDLKAGEIVRQHVELPAVPVTAVATMGTLEVTSEPSRVALVVDGAAVGATPLTATTLAAGDHVLSARFPSGTVERRVRVDAGRTTTLHLVSPGATTDSIVGWLAVDTPLSMRILEEGRLLGTTDVNRVMLPVGTHVLHFVSDETGFEADRTVTVTAGRPTAVRIEAPNSTISINARPWAEVFVDGERIGETPIGNLSRPIGRHEIVLRHPELGERRQSVVLTSRAPTRVSVDFQSRAQ
jgi:hypothetical protein